MCDSAHIFRCSYSSRATRRLFVGNGCSSPELCNPIQYCLACRNLSIPPDVKKSSKNTLHYDSGITVLKKRFHGKRSMLFRPMLHDNHRSYVMSTMTTDGFKPLYPAICFTAPSIKMPAWR
jgi:hypothetical protein